MNSEFSYSVAIRTVGTAGEKYIKLLESIKKQTVKPEKVLIVLPLEAPKPATYLGTEEFVFVKRGMITQRISALKYVKSDYILFCDDDVEFSEDFVETLFVSSKEANMDCVAGPLLEFFPPRKIKYYFASLLGSVCVMVKDKKNQYVRLLKTGGWSYNWDIDVNSHKIYNTDSFPWTCFFIKRDVLENISFCDELWAEQFGYAAYDDQIFAAKLKINGYRSGIVSDAIYTHNDGKTSTSGNMKVVYARAFNKRVYWHRFIYLQSSTLYKKIGSIICFTYTSLISLVYDVLLFIVRRKKWSVISAIIRGYKDAGEYIKGDAYKQLRSPIIN